MQTIQSFLTAFSKTFRQQGIIGKSVMACGTFILMCCLCSIPVSFFSDSQTPTPIKNISGVPTAGVETALAGNNQTLIANVQNNALTATITFLPTDTSSLPSATPTLAFTPTSTTQPILDASCIPNNPPQTGKVIDVIDGDTIKVKLDQDGRTDTVRYIGINAPGFNTTVEFFGSEAAVKNVELVFGKNVTLIKDVSERDDLGRLLRYVIVDNVFINYELVAQGYAYSISTPPDIACIDAFQEAAQRANSSKLGVWNPPPTAASGGGGSGGVTSFDHNGDGTVTCADFSTQTQALVALNAGYTNLDREGDGIPCESLPK